MLASIADAEHTAIWQRSADKKQKRPTRITRPGVVDESERKFGSGARTAEEIEAIFAKLAERDAREG